MLGIARNIQQQLVLIGKKLFYFSNNTKDYPITKDKVVEQIRTEVYAETYSLAEVDKLTDTGYLSDGNTMPDYIANLGKFLKASSPE